MTDLIRLAHNPTVAKLLTKDRKVMNFVSEKLSFMVEGAEHMQAFKSKHWTGRSSFFEFRTQSFPAGFVHLIHNELIAAGHKVQLIRKPLPLPLGPESPIVDEFGNDNPKYDYQMRSLRQVERHGRGVIRVATGGGKSKIAKLIMARYRRPTLFLTTRGVLLYQMKDAIDKQFNVGILGDSQWSPVRGINLGMVQTFVAKLELPDLDAEIRSVLKSMVTKDPGREPAREELLPEAKKRFEQKTKDRNKALKFLEIIEVVIGEEAHEAGGESYYKILKHCKNAQIRVALTATPFMRENMQDNMRLMAAFGPILINISEKDLIDRGILATPFFKFVCSKPHPKLRKSSPWLRAFQLGYIENEFMIADIVADAQKAARYKLPVICLTTRKAHGEVLVPAYRAAGLTVAYIRGEHDQDERKRALTALARGEIDVLVGSNIVDVGVDVPAVGLVQLAGGGKAQVQMRQRVGRGLRAKKNGPNVCFIVDYTTEPNATLRDHARQRRQIIEDTPGFVEGILPPGRDFDWKQFEPMQKAA